MTGRIGDVPSRFMVTHDWSYGEMFNYLKWMALIALCLLAWGRTRSSLYAGFAAAFAVLLFDDMLQLHERFGSAVVVRFDLNSAPWGCAPKNFGELFVWGILGIVVLAALVIGFAFARRQDRGVGMALLATLAGLVLCGVVLDMIAVAASGLLGAGPAKTLTVWGLHLLEDGGEMIFASLAVAVAAGALVSLQVQPELAPLRLTPAPDPLAPDPGA